MKKLFSIILSLHLILTPMAAVAEEELYTITGTGSREGLAVYLNSIMVTASGAVGANLYKCNAKNPISFSHYIFMAGAVAHLASEIAKAIQEKEALELNQKQISNQSLATQSPTEDITEDQKNSQMALLNTALSEEKRIKEILQTRMAWMTAVEIVYWLAVGGAAAEVILHAMQTYSRYTDDSIDCSNKLTDKQKKIVNVIAMAYGINPSSIASEQWTEVLLQGVQGYAFVKMLSKNIDKIEKVMEQTVQGSALRVVGFGVFAGYASYVRTGYKKNKERAEKNITQLEKIIDEWEKATISNTTLEPDIGPTGNNNPTNQPGTIKPLPVNQLAQSNNCVSAGSTGIEVSANACKNPIKFDQSKIKFDSPYLQSMSNLSMDMANSMAKGDSASAQIAVNQINANASRIKKEVAALLKKADEKLKKAGKPSLNLASSIPSQIASLESEMKKIAMDSKVPITDTPAVAQESKSEKSNEPIAVAPIVEVPMAKTDSGLLVGESSEASTGAISPAPESLDNFVVNESDILKNPEVSIFKQLSNRYFQNLPKIFERKKVEESVKK